VQDEFLHCSILSKDTYDEVDKDDATFSGNQCVSQTGYGSLDSDDNNEEAIICDEPTCQWKTLLQGMTSVIQKEAWIDIHVANGYDQLVNQVQGQDLRPTETLTMFHARLWKWRDDNGVIHPIKINKRCRMDTKEKKVTKPKKAKKE
jgi:hypothetical protein